MKNRFQLFKRGKVFYVEDTHDGKQESLRTRDKAEAQQLVAAKNEAHRQPQFNLAIAKVYLSAHDTSLVERTWSQAMDLMAQRGKPVTQTRTRRAMRSPCFNLIRDKRIVETTAEDFFEILKDSRNSTNNFLRQLQNFALGLGSDLKIKGFF